MNKEQTYLFEYEHEGGTYSLEVVSTSEFEAREKLRSMQRAQLCGTLVCKLPAWPGIGIVARCLVWARNFFRGVS